MRANVADVSSSHSDISISSSCKESFQIAISRLFESPKTMKNTELEINPNIMTGLLPSLSLIDPRIGVKRNCASEYTAITTPTQKSLLPTSFIPCPEARS